MLIESSNKIRDKNLKENCVCRGDDDEGEEVTSAPEGPVPQAMELLSENLRFFYFEENVRVWINKNPAGEIQLGFTF
jgi:hypothetical protein